jgi:carboxyl-terminal processing protease
MADDLLHGIKSSSSAPTPAAADKAAGDKASNDKPATSDRQPAKDAN